jgi:hypothetical protein
VIYKFVELSVVTDETLEQTVNAWVGKGWQLDAIRFVTSDQSRRPQMAFVSFVRAGDEPARDVPQRSELRRRGRVIDLGEIDLGAAAPVDAELDWSQAKRRRRKRS